MSPSPSGGIAPDAQELRLKFFGVGGAGCRALEHLARSGLPAPGLIAINTDIPALLRTSIDSVIPLGARLTRGLGTGGDPELGRAAAEEEAEMLSRLCAGQDVVFVLAGLGGGLGTGAAPVLARVAREAGALVVAVATLPFTCEGTRRQTQAAAGLDALKEAADAVLCLPNQRVLGLIDDETSLVDTFEMTNGLLARGVAGLSRLLSRGGLIHADFGDLCAAVRGRHAESCFATAEAVGPDRAQKVVEELFRSPLLDGSRVLAEAGSALVSIVGGPDLTMTEVNQVMERINAACPRAGTVMGAQIDPAFQGQISVTVVASQVGDPGAPGMSATDRAAAAPAGSAGPSTGGSRAPGDAAASAQPPEFLRTETGARPAFRFAAPPPELTPEEREQAYRQGSARTRRKAKSRFQQGVLPLEIVSKGRFERSEPTVYQGEDLDVPTYIRRGVPLN